jgi:hypothetical protein
MDENYELIKTLSLATLYECEEDVQGVEGEIAYDRYGDSRSIWVNSGTVNIYSSNSAVQPYMLTQMTLNTEDTNVGGLLKVSLVPKYIYVTQNTGTSSEIRIKGIKITSKGALV